MWLNQVRLHSSYRALYSHKDNSLLYIAYYNLLKKHYSAVIQASLFLCSWVRGYAVKSPSIHDAALAQSTVVKSKQKLRHRHKKSILLSGPMLCRWPVKLAHNGKCFMVSNANMILTTANRKSFRLESVAKAPRARPGLYVASNPKPGVCSLKFQSSESPLVRQSLYTQRVHKTMQSIHSRMPGWNPTPSNLANSCDVARSSVEALSAAETPSHSNHNFEAKGQEK